MKKSKPPSSFQDFLYRFDVYLSLQDKAGQRIDPSKLFEIRNEIIDTFGGVTTTSIVGNPVYHGFWRSPKTREIASDWNTIFTVLVPQDEKSIRFFLDRKEQWRKSLDYEALLITVHQIQVI